MSLSIKLSETSKENVSVKLIDRLLAVGTFVSIVAALSFTPQDYLLEVFFASLLAVFIVALIRCYVVYTVGEKANDPHRFWVGVMAVSFGWLTILPIASIAVDLVIRDQLPAYETEISVILSLVISFLLGGYWFGRYLRDQFDSESKTALVAN